ncbi:MAG: thiol-disulfide oxidoreductase DCC family protein [Flavobacteriaceae bacterium]|nr:thiol-disulfide oxidoreductase DCC family protein [Flavobacteriaceae bacterium]MDZ4149139.1 thiol-disulfide oxidoreductase DCC family protein [Flavobacteriaceae bacterium]
MDQLPKNKEIILFDGVCNLCNGAVLFIIKRDRDDVFRFVSLQSELGKEIIRYIGVDVSKTDSIVWYKPGEAYYYKSDAALMIINHFGGIWGLLNVFKIIPASLRNLLYDFIARNRYNWFGKKESCMIPTPELQQKFL